MSEDSGLLVQFLLALGIVLILIIGLAWMLKKINKVSSRVGRHGEDPRLTVTEALSVDHKRRLVLVKRDSVEHLLLIGGENDVLVEQNIASHHQPQQLREQQSMHPAPAPAATQAAPQPAPMASARPTQVSQPHAPRPSAPTQQQPTPAQPQAPSMPQRMLQQGQGGVKSAVGGVAAAGAGAAAALGSAGSRLVNRKPEAAQQPTASRPAASQAPVSQTSQDATMRAETPPPSSNTATKKTSNPSEPSEPKQPARESKPERQAAHGRDEGSKDDQNSSNVETGTKPPVTTQQAAKEDTASKPTPDLATAVRRPRPEQPEEKSDKVKQGGNEPDQKPSQEATETKNEQASKAQNKNHLSDTSTYDDEINRLLNELTQDSSK